MFFIFKTLISKTSAMLYLICYFSRLPICKDTLKSQVEDGSFVTQGTSDVLTMALGTTELSGQVRGIGKGVTPTIFFHISRRGSKKHISELESRLHEEVEKCKEKDKELQALKEQFIKLQGGLASPPFEKIGSNTQKSDNSKYIKVSSNINDSPVKKKNETINHSFFLKFL